MSILFSWGIFQNESKTTYKKKKKIGNFISYLENISIEVDLAKVAMHKCLIYLCAIETIEKTK